MIDAHVHFWKYNQVKDAWITDEMKLLQRDFLPDDLKPALDKNKVEGVVAVQADQNEKETEFLISLANQNPSIRGVIGWTDFQNENIDKKLLYYSGFNIIKGFRHIVQGEPDGFLRNEKFLNGIKALQHYGLTYDILIYEKQLREAIIFINKFPNQKFILNHCAKPAIKDKKINEWKSLMKEISQDENIFCKLSGLLTEARWNQWREKDFYPYLDIVVECFGTNRLLFGSDWPVILLSGAYVKWKRLLENYFNNFSDEEKQKVFGGNAIKFYDLDPVKFE
ncbi:MAG: amidohydrolase family protein [Ginsengibacter sp.]